MTKEEHFSKPDLLHYSLRSRSLPTRRRKLENVSTAKDGDKKSLAIDLLFYLDHIPDLGRAVVLLLKITKTTLNDLTIPW